jgi:hypothetical protein
MVTTISPKADAIRRQASRNNVYSPDRSRHLRQMLTHVGPETRSMEMKEPRMQKYRAILLALCATFYTVSAWAQPLYTVTEVDIHVEGVGQSLAWDGGIVGSVRPGDGSNQPALWRDGHTTMLLDVDGIALAGIYGIKAGLAYFPMQPFTRPMEWWPEDGQVFFWDVPAGTHSGQINDINGNGVAACTYSDGRTVSAARCTRAGFEVLPTLGGSRTEATVITNTGTVAGSAENEFGNDRIVVWHTDGQVVDYGNLGGSGANLYDLNDHGELAGVFTTKAGEVSAFGGSLSTGLQRLVHPDGFESSAALGLNNHSVRVGRADKTTSGPSGPTLIERAMLWSGQFYTPIDLNSLIDPASGWELRQAISINDAGEILARAFHAFRGARVVLLEPTHGPAIVLELNQTSFGPGETLRMTVYTLNGGPPVTTDVYIGVILPDGASTLFITFSGFVGPVPISGDARTFTPYVEDARLPEGSMVTWPNFLTYRFNGGEAPGTYHLFAAWTKPDSLQDGRIDDGDVLALGWAPLHFSRGTAGLHAIMRAIQAKHAGR